MRKRIHWVVPFRVVDSVVPPNVLGERVADAAEEGQPPENPHNPEPTQNCVGRAGLGIGVPDEARGALRLRVSNRVDRLHFGVLHSRLNLYSLASFFDVFGAVVLRSSVP